MLTPEALVQKQVDAYNAQDLEVFLSTFHPEVEFIEWPDRLAMRGHEAFRACYGALWASSPRLRADILNRIVIGRFVIDQELLVNHADGVRPALAVIYEMQGELIRRFWVVKQET